jgi:hypothetical protein
MHLTKSAWRCQDTKVIASGTTSAYLGLDVSRRKLLEGRLSAVLEKAGETFHSTTFATLVTARVSS